jgi:hypothetical protein
MNQLSGLSALEGTVRRDGKLFLLSENMKSTISAVISRSVRDLVEWRYAIINERLRESDLIAPGLRNMQWPEPVVTMPNALPCLILCPLFEQLAFQGWLILVQMSAASSVFQILNDSPEGLKETHLFILFEGTDSSHRWNLEG